MLGKTALQPVASASNGAGATTNSAWEDNTDSYETTIIGLFTNGGTGPTVGMAMNVFVADDSSGTNAQLFSTETAPVTAGASGNYQPVVLPTEIMFYRVQFTGNTGQAVTCQAQAWKVTSL